MGGGDRKRERGREGRGGGGKASGARHKGNCKKLEQNDIYT